MKLLSIKEASAVLDLAPSTLYVLVAQRRIPHHRVGTNGSRGVIKFTAADLDAFLASARVEAETADNATRPINRLKHIGS